MNNLDMKSIGRGYYATIDHPQVGKLIMINNCVCQITGVNRH